LLGPLEIVADSAGVTTFDVGFFAPQQAQVKGRVPVVRVQLQHLQQYLHSLSYAWTVFCFEVLTHLHVSCVSAWGNCQLGLGVATQLISLGPFDHGNRVVGLGIVGISLDRLAVVLFGFIELFQVEIDAGQHLDGIHVSGVLLEDILVVSETVRGPFTVPTPGAKVLSIADSPRNEQHNNSQQNEKIRVSEASHRFLDTAMPGFGR